MSVEKMSVGQLVDKLMSSAKEHDENTGEDNGDLRDILWCALQILKEEGMVDRFINNLREDDFSEMDEYAWLEDSK